MPRRFTCSGSVEDPDTVVVSITLTMSVKEWRQIAEQLEVQDAGFWPFGKVAGQIRQVLRRMIAGVTDVQVEEG